MNTCPVCGYIFEVNEGIYNPTAKPTKGDITLCINCGSILMFTDDSGTNYRPVSEMEILKWSPQAQFTVHQLKEAWRKVRKR